MNKIVWKLTPNKIKIDKIFIPNKNGISNWISVKEFTDGGLKWTKNGNIRHNICWGDNRYIWEAKRKTSANSSEVITIRTNGFNKDYLNSSLRPILKDSRELHKKTGCVICGTPTNLVIDHKSFLYNDPRVLSRTTQTKEDFQCICTV